ncbi:MAG: N-formylglutamate amidohydrolase [Hyphomicrobiales bacterium]
MTRAGAELFEPSFELRAPRGEWEPVLFSSPHSGRDYPEHFVEQSRLDAMTLRRSEDMYVDELFAHVVDMGAPLLAARFPRAYLDVNREPYELDPRLFDGKLPSFANTRSPRVAAGLGTIPRLVGDALEIYRRALPVEAGMDRIETLYKPFHQTLRRTLEKIWRHHGVALLVDCHSMPSAALDRHGIARADFVLGDRFGSSAAPSLSDLIESHLSGRGFRVVRNRPYAGGYITEYYGTPDTGCHAIQIEINRGLYLDERRLEKLDHFSVVQAEITLLSENLIGFMRNATGDSSLAAE